MSLTTVPLFVARLVLLIAGAEALVRGAARLATAMGITPLVAGPTVVAFGTSAPELAVSVRSAFFGQADVGLGNVVGSNIFNILVVLGLSAAVAPSGIAVSHTAIVFDIPVMVLVTLACLPIFFTGYRVERWEGFLFLGYYAAYVIYLALDSTRSGALSWYRFGIVGFALPITVYVLAESVLHHVRKRGLSN